MACESFSCAAEYIGCGAIPVPPAGGRRQSSDSGISKLMRNGGFRVTAQTSLPLCVSLNTCIAFDCSVKNT
jgi:hypothetical protein